MPDNPPGSANSVDVVTLVQMSGRRRLRVLIPVAIAGVAIIGLVAWQFLWRSTASSTTAAVQTATVRRGSVAATLTTSGSASALLQSRLTFNASGATTVTGVVATVDVKVGDRVVAGDQLATLDSRNAQRSLSQAQARLESERIRLDQLGLALSPDAASAAQAVAAAQAQLQKATNDVRDLERSPTYAQDLASARQAVSTAQASLLTSEQALRVLVAQTQSSSQLSALQRQLDELTTQRNVGEQALRVLEADNRFLEVSVNDLTDAVDRLCRSVGNGDPCGAVALEAADVRPLVSGLQSRLHGSVDLPALLDRLNANPGADAPGFAEALFNTVRGIAAAPGLQERIHAIAYSIGQVGVPSENDTAKALATRDSAAAALAAAQARLDSIVAGASQSDLEDARTAAAASQSAVQAALAKQAALPGQENLNYALQQQQVLLATTSLQQAKDAVDDAVLKAPFDGVVGAVSISPGDLVSPSTPTITLTAPDRIAVQLVVSETDLPGLSSGQLGTATFDALPRRTYVVRMTGVSNIPTVTQGVVTYQAQAEILAGPGLLGERERSVAMLRALGVVNGEVGGDDAAAFIDRAASQGLPTPGMNASVSIVEEIVQDALLVPATAVRRQGTQTVVYVLKADGTQEERRVLLGASDGTNTAIISGVELGDEVVTGGLRTAATAQSAPGGVLGPGGVR